jgi:hypothetical protein
MRLSELNPLWILKDNQQIGMIFKCPCCVKAQKVEPDWISCFWVPSPFLQEQIELFESNLKQNSLSEYTIICPCKYEYAWTKTGSTFEDITIHPSIDASSSGNWHGFITAGNIS